MRGTMRGGGLTSDERLTCPESSRRVRVPPHGSHVPRLHANESTRCRRTIMPSARAFSSIPASSASSPAQFRVPAASSRPAISTILCGAGGQGGRFQGENIPAGLWSPIMSRSRKARIDDQQNRRAAVPPAGIGGHGRAHLHGAHRASGNRLHRCQHQKAAHYTSLAASSYWSLSESSLRRATQRAVRAAPHETIGEGAARPIHMVPAAGPVFALPFTGFLPLPFSLGRADKRV